MELRWQRIELDISDVSPWPWPCDCLALALALSNMALALVAVLGLGLGFKDNICGLGLVGEKQNLNIVCRS